MSKQRKPARALQPVEQNIAGRSPENSRPALQLFVAICILLGVTTAWAADEVDIDRANWSSDRNRLTVRGDHVPDYTTVTIRYGEKDKNGAVIGTTKADGDGDWEFRITDLNPVPCHVTAQAAGRDDDDKEVRRAPRSCSDDGGSQPPPPVEPPPVEPPPVEPPPVDSSGVSINSTSQNCGSADISGNHVACNENAVDEQPMVGNTGNHTIVAINDLGMHCGDLDTRISSILPPFQVLLAQVIRKGAEPEILSPDQVKVFYSAASNPADPILFVDPLIQDVFRGLTADGSVYKTNFWDYPVPGETYDAFYPAFDPFDPTFLLTPLADPPFNITYDVSLPVPNVEHLYIGPDGILDGTLDGDDEFLAAALQHMPGITNPYVANDPQQVHEHLSDKPFFTAFPFGYVANDVNWFEGAGIPFASYDDAGRENAYPLVRVQATTDGDLPNPDGSNVVATVDTVLPISGEASCRNCHASSMDSNFGLTRTTDPEDKLLAAGLPVVDSETDPLLIAGSVPVDVAVEWATDINILRLHDLRHGANYVAPSPADDGTTVSAECDITANAPDGDPNCLTSQALAGKPVVCQVCHYTPALDLAQLGPLTGPEGSIANGRNQLSHKSNSNVMHSHHGGLDNGNLFPPMPAPIQDPETGEISNQGERLAVLEETCYQCHPGTNVQCLRGAMFNGGMLCNDCHGSMEQVGNDFSREVSPTNSGLDKFLLSGNFYEDPNQPRVPWANEPGCGSCHTGDVRNNQADMANTIANTRDIDGNLDGIRLRQAYVTGDAKATPIVPTNKRFAEPEVPEEFNGTPNKGAGNPQLYRVSTGHGGVMCEGCHGATHAEWPNGNPNANDNVAANQLQGHTGPIVECDTCHTNVNDLSQDATPSSLRGPHGMHAVGANTDFATGKHKEKLEEGQNKNACIDCHGKDGQGSVLSRMAEDRVLECKEDTAFCPDGKTALFPKGHAVGCVECHKNGLFED